MGGEEVWKRVGCRARHCPAALQLLPWLRPGAWKGVVSDAVVAAGQRFRILRKEGEDRLEWVSGMLVGGGRGGFHLEVM